MHSFSFASKVDFVYRILGCQLRRKDIRGWLTGHEHVYLRTEDWVISSGKTFLFAHLFRRWLRCKFNLLVGSCKWDLGIVLQRPHVVLAHLNSMNESFRWITTCNYSHLGKDDGKKISFGYLVAIDPGTVWTLVPGRSWVKTGSEDDKRKRVLLQRWL